jgi:hypothetical protein
LIILNQTEKEDTQDLEDTVKNPLHTQIDSFIRRSEIKFQDVQARIVDLKSDLTKTRELFGEEPNPPPSDDMCSTFFIIFIDFMRKFSVAYKQSIEWKEQVRSCD